MRANYNGNQLATATATSGGTVSMKIEPVWTTGGWWGQGPRSQLEGTQSGVDLPGGIAGVYLCVAKFENMGSSGTETLWTLSAANYDAIKAGGITEAELNANYSNRIIKTSMASASLNNNYVRIGVNTNGGSSTATFDEIKYARPWAMSPRRYRSRRRWPSWVSVRSRCWRNDAGETPSQVSLL